MAVEIQNVFRFEEFEVREQELRATRSGQPLSIEPKAFRVLLYLLHHAGHLVTKNELLDAIWGDTAVTDNSLTRAIALLRRVLEDDPHQPHFIETVSTAGYRFIASVESGEPSGNLAGAAPGTGVNGAALNSSAGQPVLSPDLAAAVPAAKRKRWPIMVASAAFLVCSAGTLWYLRRPLPLLRISQYVRLTLDGRKKEVVGTDGNSIFLNVSDPDGIAEVPISGGKVVPIVPDLPKDSLPPGLSPAARAVSPDGSSLLVLGQFTPDFEQDVWVVGTLGRPARFLTQARTATWSPDGKQVLYASAHGDLYVMPSQGGTPRLLVSSSAPSGSILPTDDLAWSPDGAKIRLIRDYTIWEVSSGGSNLHQVIPGWRDSHFACCGRWTPDGSFYVFLSGNTLLKGGPLFPPSGQIWVLDERRGPLGQRNEKPFQLSSPPTLWGAPVPSRDGKRIFARGADLRGELVHFDKESRQLKPYLEGISAEFLSFSHNGKYVAYVSFPEGVLWRANRDGAGLTQLTSPPVYPKNPRWSPDDSSLAFTDYSPEHQDEMYIIPSQGGTPRRLLPDDKEAEGEPTWSPDGKKVVFNVFAGFVAGPVKKPELRILDLETRAVVKLPERPGGAWSPRWSPDGRYIAALNFDADEVVLFDLQAKRWTTLFHGTGAAWPCWSHDSRFLYFAGGTLADGPRVFRVPVTGGKAEPVVELRGFRWTGFYANWFGLDPGDNPLLLRDQGTDEIYALTVERK